MEDQHQPGQSEQAAEIDALVEAVEAGRDEIEVPRELTEEAATGHGDAARESVLVRVQHMTVGEKIKAALRGNREVRALLIRDPNRLVSRLVLRNPRITEEEVIAVTHNRTVDSEFLRIIADNREWTRVYQVRIGLVSNPRMPVVLAMRFLPTLDDRDIRRLAKSKNVPEAVTAAARRMVANRQLRGQ